MFLLLPLWQGEQGWRDPLWAGTPSARQCGPIFLGIFCDESLGSLSRGLMTSHFLLPKSPVWTNKIGIAEAVGMWSIRGLVLGLPASWTERLCGHTSHPAEASLWKLPWRE